MEVIVTHKYTFFAPNIKVSLMFADLFVVAYDQPEIMVEAVGDDYVCSHLISKIVDQTLTVSFPVPLLNGRYTSTGSPQQINGTLCVDFEPVDLSRKIQVVIHIPGNTNLDVKKLIGNSHIGNFQGDLTLQGFMGFENFTGAVGNCEIGASSSFKASVERVVGNLMVNGSSSAKVQIGEVSSPSIKLDLSSHAHVSISGGIAISTKVSGSSGATASLDIASEIADLSGSSGANIHLRHCIKPPRISKSSGASVSVG